MNHPANHPFNEPDAELLQRAQRAGIATTYTGFWGDPVRVSADVLTRALDAMGQHADATVVPEAIGEDVVDRLHRGGDAAAVACSRDDRHDRGGLGGGGLGDGCRGRGGGCREDVGGGGTLLHLAHAGAGHADLPAAGIEGHPPAGGEPHGAGPLQPYLELASNHATAAGSSPFHAEGPSAGAGGEHGMHMGGDHGGAAGGAPQPHQMPNVLRG